MVGNVSYPEYLATMLKSKPNYEVFNVGGTGLTLTNRTEESSERTFPGFAQTIKFKESLKAKADYVYLLFGMNDSKYKYNE